jgi:hypothetical protein
MSDNPLLNKLYVHGLNKKAHEHSAKHGEICDFCGDAPTTWVHYTSRFLLPFDPPVPGVEGMKVEPEWATCQVCHEMIERGDKAGMRVRADKLMSQHYLFKGRPVNHDLVVSEVWRMHEAFWEHRVPRQPLQITGFYQPE